MSLDPLSLLLILHKYKTTAQMMKIKIPTMTKKIECGSVSSVPLLVPLQFSSSEKSEQSGIPSQIFSFLMHLFLHWRSPFLQSFPEKAIICNKNYKILSIYLRGKALLQKKISSSERSAQSGVWSQIKSLFIHSPSVQVHWSTRHAFSVVTKLSSRYCRNF